jgi:hypothetical protein
MIVALNIQPYQGCILPPHLFLNIILSCNCLTIENAQAYQPHQNHLSKSFILLTIESSSEIIFKSVIGWHKRTLVFQTLFCQIYTVTKVLD